MSEQVTEAAGCPCGDERPHGPHEYDPQFGFTLTDRERQVTRHLGDVWGELCAVVGDGPTRDADLREMCNHIHALQHAVMSNAAGRAYPDEFRLLGDTITRPSQDAAGEHTRASTPDGPDYCRECSEAAHFWVTWPCQDAAGDAGRSA